MTQPRWILCIALFVATPLLLPGRAAGAPQQTCDATPFLAVTSWTGSVSITGTGSGTVTVPGHVYTYSVQQRVELSPVLTPSTIYPGGNFDGPENAIVTVNDQYTDTIPTDAGPLTFTSTVTANGSTDLGAFPGFLPGVGARLSISSSPPPACGYAFGANSYFSPGTETDTPGTSSQGTINWGPPNIPNQLDPPSTPTSIQMFVPFPISGTTLSGSTSFISPPWQGTINSPPSNSMIVQWTVSWRFFPTPRPLDLIVTIPQYNTWRPSAGKTETDPGSPGVNVTPNYLEIRAQLFYKDTQQPTDFDPDKITFKLLPSPDSSAEPGVTMNWPAKNDLMSPQPPDLSFAVLDGSFSLNPKYALSANGTQADYSPPSTAANETFSIFLIPYDWGGWATLNVTATVPDRPPIQGHFSGDATTNILLPKSQPGSHIADIWKSQNNVPLSTPDSDDSEVSPQGRPDCVGDGFTLYEEYRGFMENGKHIEGDPHNKDFFILNEIGADAEPGIFLFTALTGLTVHKDIQKNEVETTPRPILLVDGVPAQGNPLINFNVGQGAFEVQQHGMLIRTCDVDGGQTLWPNAGPRNGNQIFAANHAQPGITDMICMQERDAPGTISPGNTHEGSIAPVNALLQYDVAVAHELLHSVGVLHHGDRDDEGPRSFTLLFPSDPRNTAGQPVFQLAGTNVRVLDEQSGQDQAVNLWNSLLALAQQCDAMKANPGAFPPSLADVCAVFKIALTNPLTGQFDTSWDQSFWVGEPQGKHSGNDQCVMRYFVANAYPSIAPLVGVPVFYTVPAGTEPVGFSLCTSPAGTGVNDPNRTLPTGHPQPRYFDARSGRGACQKWVCVNDFYAPAADSQ